MHEYNRINKFLPLMQSLYNTAKEELGFGPHVKIVIIKNNENMKNPLGKTAHYSPGEHKIALFTQGRHIKDILRSLSHELVHHNQNCRGDFDSGAATVEGYAQEDGHLREMEREAYECGNMIFRDWEDNLKKKGARPLFTSTHYANAIMEKGEKLMENSLKESQLRNIIRGVIQEMFDEDLNEADNMGMPADVESQEAAEVEAEKAGGQVGAVYKGVQEGAMAAMAGKALGAAAKKVGSAALGAATDKAKELGTQALEKGASKLKGALDESEEEMIEDLQSTKGHFSKTKKDPKTDMHVDYEGNDDKKLAEDSEGEETYHYGEDEGEDKKRLRKGDLSRGHRDALKKDMAYDEEHEDRRERGTHFRESFFPEGRSIRQKARLELNEALMKRWNKIIK